jgi:uncharacterized protein (TIGR03083 family)
MERSVDIPTLHLFPVLHELLMDLLRSLTPEQWQMPTVAKLWTVKDVAAHLLDVNVRNIAEMHGYEPPVSAQINSYADLVNYLNELNAVWVSAMKRISPSLLIQMMESTGRQHIQYLNTLDPFGPAKYPVAWAGEDTSLNWFHTAREYTEKWHHQQQIREAVGSRALMTRELYYPCIGTFMYALPHAYRNTPANTGDAVKVTISGEAGGDWWLKKAENKWELHANDTGDEVAHVVIPSDVSWKFFTRAVTCQRCILCCSCHGLV